MVSLIPNPPEGFYLDPMGMALPNIGSFSAPTASPTSSEEDPSMKIRKPYTITKSRESWTEPEHDKFLEALQLFDRDWKKIETFVGSKTVIQIRSHAEKYFLKVQKSGTHEHLPPPRPKRKATHPYPQKASKNAVSSRTENSVQSVSLSHMTKGEMSSAGQQVSNNGCSSTESTPRTRPACGMNDHSFIGSVFDPTTTGHLQKLKKMDPIDVETVLLLMRNLSINLTSPDFEDHRRLLSSYEIDSDEDNSDDAIKNPP